MGPVLDSSSFAPIPALKPQNPLLSYVQERERKYTVNVQCNEQYTLFNDGNVLLCVIYQLNFTVYIAFGIIHGFT
jgi:hypothetical protein